MRADSEACRASIFGRGQLGHVEQPAKPAKKKKPAPRKKKPSTDWWTELGLTSWASAPKMRR